MPIQMVIESNSGVDAVEVPEDVAADLQEAYEALAKLPRNKCLGADFDTVEQVKLFVKQAKAWCEAQQIDVPETISDDGKVIPARVTALKFERKGDIEAAPLHVRFRIYLPGPPRGPLSEEAKAQRAASRERNRQAAAAELGVTL